MHVPVLIVPGIGNSGPQHWQSIWEARNPAFVRVTQKDWDHPVRFEWVSSIEQAIAAGGPGLVVVAHSLGCLAVVHWAAGSHLPIKGALLVAVPDPRGPKFPVEAVGFAPVPRRKLAFPSVVVMSTDDPYGSVEYVQGCASAWGSRLVSIGAAGHINTESGLGEWPEGFELLETLRDDQRWKDLSA